MKENKIENIDFVIYDNEYSKTIFRFRPKDSHCHSFGDSPPTKWSEVYKVYYSYMIFTIYKDDPYDVIYTERFNQCFDECSAIDQVAYACKLLSENKEEVVQSYGGKTQTIKLLDREISSFGDGTSWIIKKEKGDIFWIELFKWNNVGYRFLLTKDKLREFSEYLDKCCEYMLEHGDPI